MTPDEHRDLAVEAVAVERSGDAARRRDLWRRLAALPRPDADAVAVQIAAIKGAVPRTEVPPANAPRGDAGKAGK